MHELLQQLSETVYWGMQGILEVLAVIKQCFPLVNCNTTLLKNDNINLSLSPS